MRNLDCEMMAGLDMGLSACLKMCNVVVNRFLVIRVPPLIVMTDSPILILA